MTVTPAAPAAPARDHVVVVRTPSPQPALPLGRLPEQPGQPAGSPTAPSPESPGAAQPAPARPAAREDGTDGEDGEDEGRRRAPRRSGKAHEPAPAKVRGPRTRPRPHARPAPGRASDMAPLCAAAKGTVSPSIAQLCADQYGH
ncbi:hypothetical protein ABT084_34590 [Streptomyces sp. NPDC002138]|uniref:hypothetical protein n=1 Tax=Streptomyces sp. NPDC002138 TaxID=3154410 RepID=UPI003319643E